MAPSIVLLSGRASTVAAEDKETVAELRRRLAKDLGVAYTSIQLASDSLVLKGDVVIEDIPDDVLQVVLRSEKRFVYVCEAGGGRVSRWELGVCEPIGECVTSREGGFAMLPFCNPRGLAMDGTGALYVAEAMNNVRFGRDGARVIVAGGNGPGDALEQLATPNGIFIDDDFRVYVSEYWNHRVSRWDPGASHCLIVAGGNGQGSALHQLNNPTGLCVDAHGNIYVSDRSNHRVCRWNVGASSGEIVAGAIEAGESLNQLRCPCGLALDSEDRLYVAEHMNHRVTRWKPGGKTGELVAGGIGRGDSLQHLFGPWGVVLDEEGAVYITEEFNHRVTKWTPGSSVGELVAGGQGEGDGRNQLNSPFGLCIRDVLPELYTE